MSADPDAEREAARVAADVVGMSGPAVARGDARRPSPERASPLDAGDRSAITGELGAPLSPEATRYFEPRFGEDLGMVRVHTDGSAAAAARHLRARAFTAGRHVHFGADEYRMGSPAGRRLIAHELAHTLQERPASDSAPVRLASNGLHGGPDYEGVEFGARPPPKEEGAEGQDYLYIDIVRHDTPLMTWHSVRSWHSVEAGFSATGSGHEIARLFGLPRGPESLLTGELGVLGWDDEHGARRGLRGRFVVMEGDLSWFDSLVAQWLGMRGVRHRGEVGLVSGEASIAWHGATLGAEASAFGLKQTNVSSGDWEGSDSTIQHGVSVGPSAALKVVMTDEDADTFTEFGLGVDASIGSVEMTSEDPVRTMITDLFGPKWGETVNAMLPSGNLTYAAKEELDGWLFSFTDWLGEKLQGPPDEGLIPTATSLPPGATVSFGEEG